jgi:hypothetical protein
MNKLPFTHFSVHTMHVAVNIEQINRHHRRRSRDQSSFQRFVTYNCILDQLHKIEATLLMLYIEVPVYYLRFLFFGAAHFKTYG